MHINSLRLQNFKRFTDLTIDVNPDKSPTPPKLVLLIGANGSGKSSIFDAFEILNSSSFKQPSLFAKTNISNVVDNPVYYSKSGNFDISLSLDNGEMSVTLGIDGQLTVNHKIDPVVDYDKGTVTNIPGLKKPIFYGRSAFRYIPELQNTEVGYTNISNDDDRPKKYISLDNRFLNDLGLINDQITEQIYEGLNLGGTVKPEEINKIVTFLNTINESLNRIFQQDQKISLQFKRYIPKENNKKVELSFKKGNSELHYDLLSAGEKEVINILFNLFVRRENFQDAIYFFDEIDLHLHTELQYRLIKEIVEYWVPENSQVWIASHSLGFIDYARECERGVIIDFDNLDFDVAQELKPIENRRLDVYNIALPKEIVEKIFSGKEIIYCENLDSEYYNLAVASEGKFFIGLNNSVEVYKCTKIYDSVKQGKRGLRDGDYLRSDEKQKLKELYPQLSILRYYSFENYLYHPDNIKECFGESFDKEKYISVIIEDKKENYSKTISNIKSIRSHYFEIRNETKITEQKEDVNEILKHFESGDFETFYIYYKMKDGKNQGSAISYVKKLFSNVDKEPLESLLAKTNWFRTKILEVLEEKVLHPTPYNR